LDRNLIDAMLSQQRDRRAVKAFFRPAQRSWAFALTE
jgi:hypothetical protein